MMISGKGSRFNVVNIADEMLNEKYVDTSKSYPE